MTTAINYLIDEERVTFFKEGQIQVTERKEKPWLYESLKEALPTGNELLVFKPKDFLLQAFEQRKDCFGIAKRIKEIEAAGMPTEPYMSFISRLDDTLFTEESKTIDIVEALVSKVGTVEAPLTWDGDLVLYQRSAWTNSNKSWADDSGDFKPFNVIEGNIYAGEFTYTMKVCPDTGCAYEVIVQPQHIKSTANDGLWTLSQVMQLSKLGTQMSIGQRSKSPIVSYENKCVGDDTIAMRLPYNPVTAASVAEFMLRYNKDLRLVNTPVMQPVSC